MKHLDYHIRHGRSRLQLLSRLQKPHALSGLPWLLAMTFLLSACSMTKNIPEDDQLFRGLTGIDYQDEPEKASEAAAYLGTMKEEVEAALATTPNGALFGSSYYTSPFSFSLWVHNLFSQKESKFAKWMTRTFGKPPVLMSQVNPTLRASVAQSVLRNHGYFRGNVSYEAIPQKNPRKCKIGYTVKLDSLFTFDSIAYTNFPTEVKALIDSTQEEALIRKGGPFSVSALDMERSRISTLFRNSGYYYYNPSYTSYLADTFAVADKAQLQLRLADDLPDEALHKWYIGHLAVRFRKTMREQATDSIKRRHLTIFYNGKHSPIRPRVVLKNLKLRPRQPFSYEQYQQSASLINATGVFSSVDFQFSPRLLAKSDSAQADTLDLLLNCTFDKPYDFYVETNLTGSTIGRYGPELKLGFTKRNAFRGAEKLDINLHGSYEWQRSSGSNMSNYQYGADAAVEFPRIIAPFYNSEKVRRDKNGRPKRRNYNYTPTTIAKVSTDIIRRPDYYKMHIVSGEWSYHWQSSAQSTHDFSPLTLKYQKMNSSTQKFDSIMLYNPYLLASMADVFVPKMRYTYTYTSPATLRNPIRWETTVEESGNLTSLWDLAAGHSLSEKGKTLFKTEYSQFLRLETDLTKTWTMSNKSSLVGHFNAGIIYTYGNSSVTPFSEGFYAGGANSIRAFGMREIGPGNFDGSSLPRQWAYLMQNGEMKLVGNLECRTQLFGDLHGAIFLDAGNVWDIRKDEMPSPEEEPITHEVMSLYKESVFKPSRLLDQTALGTGIGLRYDLGFLIIRIDWGLALHMPYDTGKSGYFNVPSFKGAHTLHFAIGYPF